MRANFRPSLLVPLLLGIPFLLSPLFSQSSDCQQEKDSCAHVASLESSQSANICPYKIDLRHTEGAGIGYKKGYSSTEVFLSRMEGGHLGYFDGRGHFLNQGRYAFNLGAGYRYLSDRFHQVIGANLFFDYRDTRHLPFYQMGLGLETLGKTFALRANGYFPMGRTEKVTHIGFGKFWQNHVLLRTDIKQAMWGFDGEIEAKCGSYKHVDFTFAVGGYFFEGVKNRSAPGVKARADARFYDCFYLKALASYDKLFHFNLQGEAGLSFAFSNPFTCKKEKSKKDCSCIALAKQKLQKRMVDLPLRQDLIVVSKTHGTKMAKDPSGVPYFFYHVDNTSPFSLGTAENPFRTLAEAQAASVYGEPIYVHYGDGTTYGMNNGIVLKADQQLLGSAIGHLLSTQYGEIEMTAQTPNLRPRISNQTTNGPGVTLADGCEVSGLTILAAQDHGIYGIHMTRGVKITDNIILDNGVAGDAGIYFTFDDNVRVQGTLEITNNLITSASGTSNAIHIYVPQNGTTGLDVLIDNNQIGPTHANGILIERLVSSGQFILTGEINNNHITGSLTQGIFFNVNATSGTVDLHLSMEGNTITTNSQGIRFLRANGYLFVNNNKIFNQGSTGCSIYVGDFVPENLIIDMIGNEFFDNRGGATFQGMSVRLDFGTVYCRLMGNINHSGPTNETMWLDNNTGTTSKFKAQVMNNVGPLTLDNIEVVP